MKERFTKGFKFYESNNGQAYSVLKYGEEGAYLMAEYSDKYNEKINNYFTELDDKTIIIYSYYQNNYEEIYIDKKDFNKVKQYYWRVQKDTNTKYAFSSKGKAGKDMVTIKLHNFLKPHNNEYVIDHKNGNGLDNRNKNLRIVTLQENKQNINNKVNTTTGFNGVYYHSTHDSYRCSWYENGKRKNKDFSIKKYGKEEALLNAVYYREEMEIKNNYLSARYKAENRLNQVLKNILNSKN